MLPETAPVGFYSDSQDFIFQQTGKGGRGGRDGRGGGVEGCEVVI